MFLSVRAEQAGVPANADWLGSFGLGAYCFVPDFTWLIIASLIWSQGFHVWAPLPGSMTLALAEPEGYVLVFVNEGLQMAHLLQEAVSHGAAPDSARRLLAAFPGADAARPAERKELLSEREIEVLHLIATGLTNQEIASQLYLSLYTVKAHARSIYDKLDAHSRTQATARARELGILPLL